MLLPLCVLLLGAAQLSAQPVITNQPGNQAVVWGGNATFSVMATGVGPFTYQWQLNGTNLPNNIISTVAGGNLFDHQQATNTILNSANGVAKDSLGNLFIADTYNNVIRKVDTNGLTTIVAGNGSGSFSDDGGTATNAGLFEPAAVILDPAGNLIISDTLNSRIRKVNTNGVITTVAGNGQHSFNVGDGGAATNASLYYPQGICLDGAGNIFIADYENMRIRKVATNGIIRTVAGNGTASYSGNPSDGNAATSVSLNYLYSVAVDSSNNLFIADTYHHRIRKVNTSGIISTVAGNGTAGYAGDGGAATSANLNNPVGVAVDAARNLYIVDSVNHCVRKVGTNNIITTLVGNGTNGFAGDGGLAVNANLSRPQNTTVDNLGILLIADAGNNRIRQVGTNGIITTVAGRVLNDGDSATNATLNFVAGVAFDAVGNMYIADTYNNRIRKVDTNGIISTVAGNGVPTYSGDGVAATNASLFNPYGLALDSPGNLFIADSRNSRVREVDTNGVISTVAGNGSSGSSGNDGAATNAQLSLPYGVAVDVIGNLFIIDPGNSRVRKLGTNGIITSLFSIGAPYGGAVDSAGNLYYTDILNNDVFKVFTDGSHVTAAGISYYPGGFSGDGGLATRANLFLPFGLTVDTTGNFFISDFGNLRIRKVNTNGIITTIAGNGTNGFSGDGGPAGNATISQPIGMTTDANGNLYFADQGNNRIRKLAYVDYADQPSFAVTNVTPASLSNNYSVIVTSAAGSVTSSVATVSVQLPPITPAFTASNGLYTFTWSAVSNLTYQLQSATNLAAPVWLDLGSPVTATNNSVSTTDAVEAAGQRFYRVRLWP